LLAGAVPHETQATVLLRQLKAALTARGEANSQRGHGANPLATLRTIADPLPPRMEDLPKELCDRFIGKNRTYLLKVYAKGNIWNMDQLEKFVAAVESVDSRVTGHPVQTYYASRHMESSYLWAGLYALGAVLALVWIDFRSLRHSLLAMIPLAIGFATMCGCLGWLNIPFNPANMIVLPLILGIGVDHGVHLVHLWRQQRTRFVLGDATTVALILTASTTTASFGALILARHQGLQSLGQALTLGVTTCLAASIVFFPALLAEIAVEQDMAVTDLRTEASISQTITVAKETSSDERAEARAAIVTPPAPTREKPAEVARSIEPAQVTEEEVAALLEAAISARSEVAVLDEELLARSDVPNVSIPRRRELPRRTEAA
jgi:predicted exporter